MSSLVMSGTAAGSLHYDGTKYTFLFERLIIDVGGYIYRSILSHEVQRSSHVNLRSFLEANRPIIERHRKDWKGPKRLSDEQFDKLFPENKPATSTKTFDLTLLCFLLKTLIYPSKDNRWNETLETVNERDTSEIADINRIRRYRNKIHDLIDTKSFLSEAEFWKYWSDLTRIFLHLGKLYGIPDVYKRIQKAMHDPLDPAAEETINRERKQVGDLVDLVQKMEVDQSTMMEQVGEIHTMVKKGHKPIEIDTMADSVFVKTTQYEEARNALKSKRMIVLDGAPGEGKTTIAKKLLVDVSQKEKKCIQIQNIGDMKNFNDDNVDAILIDDMFGAGIFDKDESRKWQKLLPKIRKWISDVGLDRYFVITSRTYILKEARKGMCLDTLFTDDNIFTLSSSKLSVQDKLTILQKHTYSLESRSIDSSHEELLCKISELELKPPGSSFSIGFPECARLFAQNQELHEKGVEFFQKPMTHMKTCIKDLTEKDDSFIAFFVLWTQTNRKLSEVDLERAISDTNDNIIDPIKKLQYPPEMFLRKIRGELHFHTGGFVKYDKRENTFHFSHEVVRDTVGLISYERNPTATLELCDVGFIQNYIRLPPQSTLEGTTPVARREDDENISITLPENRHCQLSLRIASCVISHTENSDVDKTENLSIFKHPVFLDETFCTNFINEIKTKKTMQTLLKTDLRHVRSLLKRYKFLDLHKINTVLRLPSFLLWQGGQLSVFAKQCFHEMRQYPEEFLREVSIASLIAAHQGSLETVQFLVEMTEQVSQEMIIVVIERFKNGREVGDILKYIQGVTPCDVVHIAALVGCHDLVKQQSLQEIGTFTSSAHDLHKASLYHIAALTQDKELINILENENIPSSASDSKGRTPFLYAIIKKNAHIAHTLFTIAQNDNALMTQDENGDTALHVAIMNSTDKKSGTAFKVLAKQICEAAERDLSMKNDRDKTPLHLACLYGVKDVVEELTVKNAQLDKEEEQLLHKFVEADAVNAIRLLLGTGFKQDKTDEEGRTPLQLAESTGKQRAAELLRQFLNST